MILAACVKFGDIMFVGTCHGEALWNATSDEKYNPQCEHQDGFISDQYNKANGYFRTREEAYGEAEYCGQLLYENDERKLGSEMIYIMPDSLARAEQIANGENERVTAQHTF